MRQFLENLTGLSIYPLLGLTIFLGFFIAVLIQMVFTKRSHFAEMAAIPLDDALPATTVSSVSQSANQPQP
jgi:hypothetical protein